MVRFPDIMHILTKRFWASIRENIVRKLAHLELLTAAQVKDILPEMVISEPWMIQGEHLMVSSTPLTSAKLKSVV
jgi:hypothetical protein